MKRSFALLLALALALAGCGGGAEEAAPSPDASSPSSAPSSVSSSSSAPEPPSQAESSSQPEEPQEPDDPWGLVPVAELPQGAQEDYAAFQEALEASVGPHRRQFYLYITGPEGEPVQNLMGILGINMYDFREGRSGKRNGLSMAGGLMPFSVYDETSAAPLYLVNDDTPGDPLTLLLEFPPEMLADWPEDYALPVTWDQETPAQSIAQNETVLEVLVTDAQGEPAPGRMVYFTPAPPEPTPGAGPDELLRPSMGIVTPYEPRYTGSDGAARFVPWKAVGSTEPPGRYSIVTQPSHLSYFDNGEEKTQDTVETAGPEGEWVTQYTITLE